MHRGYNKENVGLNLNKVGFNMDEFVEKIMSSDKAIRNFFKKPKLTKREKEVANALLKYKNMKAVAAKLSISSHSVTYHCRNIRNKLHEDKTFPAILKAVEYGII